MIIPEEAHSKRRPYKARKILWLHVGQKGHTAVGKMKTRGGLLNDNYITDDLLIRWFNQRLWNLIKSLGKRIFKLSSNCFDSYNQRKCTLWGIQFMNRCRCRFSSKPRIEVALCRTNTAFSFKFSKHTAIGDISDVYATLDIFLFYFDRENF